MLKKLQRLTTSSRVDQKQVMNETHDLAMQKINKEPNINNNNNNKNNIYNKITANTTKLTNHQINNYNKSKTDHLQQQQHNNNNNHHQIHQTNNDTYHINNTDEEKEFNVKNQQQQQQQQPTNVVANDEQVKIKEEEEEEEEELRISREPIYENVLVDVDATATTTTTTATSTTTTIIIPHKNNRNIINDENNKENNLKYILTNHKEQNIINDNNNNSNNKLSSQNSMHYNQTNHIAQCLDQSQQPQQQQENNDNDKLSLEMNEPFYQVPKSITIEPYYDAPKNLRPVPVYENIDMFYNGLDLSVLNISNTNSNHNQHNIILEPPKEKPPPPPINDSPVAFDDCVDAWSSENTYETISSRLPSGLVSLADQPTPPPIKRMNSTKRIKKELRNKRSSFLGIESNIDDDEETFLELSLVPPPPDMAQLLQEERRLEKQLYLKAAGLCDSSDTGESRDSGVSENHSRQSSEHYTNSSEENDHPRLIDTPPLSQSNQTPLLQTVTGDCAEAWTESATVAAAATKSLTEATATANAKMQCIEEKIREQEEVLRVERELLQLEQEELKRQRENLMVRENMARRELQHGAKMLMSASHHSLQELNNAINQPMAVMPLQQQQQQQQQALLQQQQQQQQPLQQGIYANLPNATHVRQTFYQQVHTDYRKSMSDINELTKRSVLPPIPPMKPLRAQHAATNGHFSNSLIKIGTPTAAPRVTNIYSNYGHEQQSTPSVNGSQQYGNMTRNTLHALSATPKPKYTDGWVQIQQQQNYQQKRKSLPENAFYQSTAASASTYNNHWLVQEAEQRRITAEQRTNKPLPDSIIQTLTERVQSKGIGERKRLKQISAHTKMQLQQGLNVKTSPLKNMPTTINQSPPKTMTTTTTTTQSTIRTITPPPLQQQQQQLPEKMLSVSGKKKCSHCGEELGRGAAMIIESLLLFYHINCFKCCVCHVQLGDGLNGTDVRVRNNKLHCQNCYSSDDGIKFSCV